jgi:adenylyl-sulfate kinase
MRLSNHLDALESQSVYILREAFNRFDKIAMLWSPGKDSNVMVWLARKAFFGHVPFPLVHVDTGKKFPETYAFRDRYVKDWNLPFLSSTCPPVEAMDPSLPPAARAAARETAGLKALIEQHGLTGIIAGVRRDEQGTRAKERVFSPRGRDGQRDVRDQPAEFWDQFKTDFPPGTHVRIHPLLHWTEIDIWHYTKREAIPVISLYFAKGGKRYRSLGDNDITFPVDSTAGTIDEIIAELETTKVLERAGRIMDHEAEDATLIEALESSGPAAAPAALPLRLPVQDIYKFDERRIMAGRIESGSLAVGDELIFSPSNKIARVKTIEAWNVPEPPRAARAGQSIGITLDEHISVERGDIASHAEGAPIETDVFKARLSWLGRQPLTGSKRYKLKLATAESWVAVEKIERAINADDHSNVSAEAVNRNEVAEVVLRANRLLALDAHDRLPRTGRFVLVDDFDIAGGGIISMEGYADQRRLITVRATNIAEVVHRVTRRDRLRHNGHVGGVVWLTGLSGAGKSTLATEVERRLFDRGFQIFMLDGDNVRHGLNANLGFTPEDRAENIRRVGEVAALFAEAGLIVITAFISPYRSDRARARQAAMGNFHEIYVKAPLEVCEARDPKGLYRRARAGEIRDFTGVSAPYEPPTAPELVVDTEANDIEKSVQMIIEYVGMIFRQSARQKGSAQG